MPQAIVPLRRRRRRRRREEPRRILVRSWWEMGNMIRLNLEKILRSVGWQEDHSMRGLLYNLERG